VFVPAPGVRVLTTGLALLGLVSCRREGVETSPSDSPTTTPAASSVSAATSVAAAPSALVQAPKPLLRDEAVGPLIARLSERAGEFPSDNYVSNETTLLDVAPALQAPRLRGRAYVGVGPEQNFSYLALLEPAVAYVIDIRRGNLLELLMYRGCFEVGRTRAEFLSALLARRATVDDASPGFGALAASFLAAKAEEALRDDGVARTLAVLDRLRVAREPGDAASIARLHDAFFKHGLSLAYTMQNSRRRYPTLAENLAAKDPSGAEATFLASEDVYARVRRFALENRLMPVVGDLGGTHAVAAIASDLRARGLLLGAFYTSNVEQYLFESKTYGRLVQSIAAMPRDEASLIVRVWFDQGRPHPAQRQGHRTTQLAVSANAFLARHQKAPFRTYWEVVGFGP
jgi:hypothetical protein